MNVEPLIFINGEQGAAISPFDRGLAYGDGLFETCRVAGSHIPLWSWHLTRLIRGAAVLRLNIDIAQLEGWLTEALTAGCTRFGENFLIKLIVTRASGGRGYRADPAAGTQVIIMCSAAARCQQHPLWQQGARVRICDHRLGRHGALAGIKHLNRLDQVFARAEWGDEFDDGLLLDYDDDLIESISGNVLVATEGELITPLLQHAGVEGVMRAYLSSLPELSISQAQISLDQLQQAQEIILTNAIVGVLPVREIYRGNELLWCRTTNDLTLRLQDYVTEVFSGE